MTLWCLKGLKSSLTCTGGPFLTERVPKNGFGAPCGDAFSELFDGAGDAAAPFALPP